MEITVGVHEDEKLIETVHNLALEGYERPGKIEFESKGKYVWLRELGTRLWLDTGDAAAAEPNWSSEVEALTTNNTLVNQVVQTGAMDGLVGYATREIRKVRPDISDHDLVIEISFLINARLALSLVQKFNANVSVELHPDLGANIHGILLFARRYYKINPDYFFIKVPMTPDGFIATRMLSAEGIPVNYTLGFSARQNYLATRFSRPWYVNVFLGRLNSLVEENHLGNPDNVGEKAALASDEMVKNIRASQSDIPTQQIAASIRNGRQVVTLAGVDVLTMPPKAAAEYLNMDITRSDIQQHNWRDIHLELDPNKGVETSALSKLWEINERFIGFVEDALKQADQMTSGNDLVELSHKHDVDLFYAWTDEDRKKIREKGKIPDLSEWPIAPIDDLMSVSALESFAKDQMELDQRIERLIHEA